jgi:hypothetical protein
VPAPRRLLQAVLTEQEPPYSAGGGYWQQLDEYFLECSEVRFSHGICPTCFGREMRALEGPTGLDAGGSHQEREEKCL